MILNGVLKGRWERSTPKRYTFTLPAALYRLSHYVVWSIWKHFGTVAVILCTKLIITYTAEFIAIFISSLPDNHKLELSISGNPLGSLVPRSLPFRVSLWLLRSIYKCIQDIWFTRLERDY